MKTTLQILCTLVFAIAALQATESIQTKPDFLVKNDQGEVVKRGIYTTDSNGTVLHYKIVDESTKETLHTEIPVYDSSGEIALTRVYDDENNLKMIIVSLESGSVRIDPNGKPIPEDEFEKIYSSEYKN